MLKLQDADNRTMSMSDTIAELTKALQVFQRNCPKIPKGTRSVHGKFADLPTIMDIIKQPLLDACLTVMQMPVGDAVIDD